MKTKNSVIALLLVFFGQSVLATTITVYNEIAKHIDSAGVQYKFVWGNKEQIWHALNPFGDLGSYKNENSDWNKLQGFVWNYKFFYGTERVEIFYYVNLIPLDIPVAKLGVKMRIMNAGKLHVAFNGKNYVLDGIELK